MAEDDLGTCRCEHCGGDPAVQEDGVLRCLCGSLLARYRGQQLELKCRRCKRIVMVPLERAAGRSAG